MSLFARFAFGNAKPVKSEATNGPTPRSVDKNRDAHSKNFKRKRLPDKCISTVNVKRSTQSATKSTAMTNALAINSTLNAAATTTKLERSRSMESCQLKSTGHFSHASLLTQIKQKRQTRLAELAILTDYRRNKSASVDAFNSFLLSLGTPQDSRDIDTPCKSEISSVQSPTATSTVARHHTQMHGRFWALIACLFSVQCRDGNRETFAVSITKTYKQNEINNITEQTET